MTDMVTYTERLPSAGETLVGESFALGFGGKGANQAVMCSLLGASVRFVGCIGRDVFGEMTLESLESFGIDTSAVLRTEAAASGAAAIWVDSTGENRIVIVPGANDLLDPDAVETAIRAMDADVVLSQLEIPHACVERALRTGRDTGAVTVLNPAPMREIEVDAFRLCSWVIPNGSELRAIARRLELDDAAEAPELTRDVGAELETEMVVTLGADGALLYEHGAGAVTSVPTPSADPVDTTGAGDAFVGAFAYAIARGAAPGEAASFGCSCASGSVEARGTQTSFPRGARLDELKHAFGLDEASP